MSLGFTGERVVPGLVDSSLWNEHLSRYRFALQLTQNKRVLDAGCGAAYGTGQIAASAKRAIGLDLSLETLDFGRSRYSKSNTDWTCGSCEALPFAPGSFDAVVAFEVIEHLGKQPAFVSEVRRVLVPEGILVVSTPNREYYSQARADSGPNLFHTVEFNLTEFRAILSSEFDHVEILWQDHAEGLLFRSPNSETIQCETDNKEGVPDQAYFFIAICSNVPLPEIPSYLYLPRTANLLMERGIHIARLTSELAMKNDWLQAAREEHSVLVEQFRHQIADLRQSNVWAQESKELADQRGQRILELQEELRDKLSAYEAQVMRLETEYAEFAQWAADNETRLHNDLLLRTAELDRQTSELSKCLDLLHAAEDLTRERTEWALALNEQKDRLEQQVAAAQSSRWLRLGKRLGVGPEFTS